MKKKILFYGSNLLYFKALIPIINILNKKCEIFVLVNTADIFSRVFFNIFKKLRPQQVNIVSKYTISWISKIINEDKKFNSIKKTIKFINKKNLLFLNNQFDCLVCTTKDTNEIKKFKDKYVNKVVIGYQHMPFIINDNILKDRNLINEDFFLKKNFFTKSHNFSFANIIANSNFFLNRFTWLNNIKKFSQKKKKKKVLIFHPGGYRNIFTKPGASKKESYDIQEKFIKKVCVPLLNNNLTPIIKIHPLHASYHGKKDCLKIIKKLNLNKIMIVDSDESYFRYLSHCKFVISFGSSSSYELWSIGFKNIFYCNFFGRIRTNKFNFLKKQFFSTSGKFLNIISSRNLNKFFSREYLKLYKIFRSTKNHKKRIYNLIID